MAIKSFYDKSESRKDNIKYTGFDFTGRIFEKTLSWVILNETKRREILTEIETMIYKLINSVKIIKVFRNFTVKKNNININ